MRIALLYAFSMAIKYKIPSPHGLITRTSAGRSYSHIVVAKDEDYIKTGFVSRLDLAEKLASKRSQRFSEVLIIEIKPEHMTTTKPKAKTVSTKWVCGYCLRSNPDKNDRCQCGDKRKMHRGTGMIES